MIVWAVMVPIFIYVTLYGLSASGKGCFSAQQLEPVIDMAMTVLDP